ncbi:5'-deoxynucleotidase HDDC2 isoform X1 [Carya illinoinensis]|nr:5'-deoxynucleotidase HDDC2 isoform X1 [Carya illinoinensis]
MLSGGRVIASLPDAAFLSLSLLVRFKSLTPHYSPSPSTSFTLYRMATTRDSFSSSSSSCSVPAGDGVNPPSTGVTDPSSAIDFLSLCHCLKTTKRTGWVRKEIKDPESIADHMYRMGLMALIASDIPGVDRNKCIKMAIVHDIAEAIVGDITPSDGISKAEKSQREREALDHMCKLLGGGSRAQEIGELWSEYEENSSPEAKVVKDLDKVEMILQALEYENEQGKDLEEFFQSTSGKFQTEMGKAWALEITSRRIKQG